MGFTTRMFTLSKIALYVSLSFKGCSVGKIYFAIEKKSIAVETKNGLLFFFFHKFHFLSTCNQTESIRW